MTWGNSFNVCSVESCEEPIRSKGLCRIHYQRMYVQGRTERVKQSREGNCSVEGCDLPIKGRRFCSKHFQLFKRYGVPEKLNKNKRSHPLYHLWFERKTNSLLCEAWLDFDTFMAAILPKPEGYYFLLQIDGSKPFGPDNFRWQENLKRKKDETNKEWWDRKRKARIAANPAMESQRNIKRQYDLSPEEHEEKLKNSNYVCEICKNSETTFDGRTGSLRKLSVDHCHNSKKLRGMLCNRCNTTLGKVDDNVELLMEMINYLNKHKD